MSNDNSEENICDKCEKKFFSKYTLASHKKKSKTCKENVEKYQCNYCSKELTTINNLNRHQLSCIEKEKKEAREKIENLEKYKEESEEEKKKYQKKFEVEKQIYQKQLENKNQIIIEKNLLIKELETKLEQTEKQLQEKDKQLQEKDKQQDKQLDTIKDLAKTAIEKKTTSTVKNTTVNNVGGDLTLYFNQDIINQKIHTKLTENDLYSGYKGIAEFLKLNIATDDNGKLIYFCVDPSRQYFCYKDDQGNEVKDLKAQKMIALIKTAMQERIAAIYEEQCKKQSRLLEEKVDINGREMQMCEFAIEKSGKMKIDIYGITDHNKMASEMAKILYK